MVAQSPAQRQRSPPSRRAHPGGGSRGRLSFSRLESRKVSRHEAAYFGKITSLQQTCDALAATVQQMVSFLGVLVPAWTTRQEVELGDEMGISMPSAAELELNVVFEMERQVPGFGHEDVITITPLAGTLVKRGSIVTVVLNLEG